MTIAITLVTKRSPYAPCFCDICGRFFAESEQRVNIDVDDAGADCASSHDVCLVCIDKALGRREPRRYDAQDFINPN